ncbi:helix-turn-helix transcriptional regulator [Mangrovicoccus sp. HB161399]|uniref:helix-turn-helix transcriptional regulator n=1 Tax=Mangrovicoccus sp. HB161399 TaxID=2720392 RepID=UPI001555A45D|nr:helix-turn-helix transcriptional regulator [Mangrovicoccus sp. HB161399]
MSQEAEIVAALFAAAMDMPGPAAPEHGDAGEDRPWQDFLALLAEATQADSALMRVSWPGRPAQSWQAGLPWDGPGEAVAERMRSGRVYSRTDLPGPAGASPAQASSPLRALRWRIGQDGQVLLALQRSGSDFRAIDGLQLSNLVPYLGLALNGWRQLRRARARAALDREICSALGAGWLLFSPSGQVTDMAEGAAGQLAAAAGIGIRADGRLSLAEPAALALRQALAALARPGAPRQQRIDLSHRPRVQLVLEAAEGPLAPALLGRLRHARAARALPPERLAGAFGISRSEARLAARICDGMSLQEAAADLGWTIGTARSASKQLFARMGAKSQAGVVRRVMESGVWLG